MRYNPRARLDRRQVADRRGGGYGSGLGGGPAGGFPVRPGRGGMRVGGGIGTVITLLVIAFVFFGNLQGGSPDQAGHSSGAGSLSGCRTGASANRSQDCAMVADVNSIQAFWSRTLPAQAKVAYTQAQTQLFTGTVRTGCGAASSQVGPFYCPVDGNVYLDPTFFRDMLRGELGAHGGKFSWAYVLAHEYGHHVQDLLGTMSRVRTQHGPHSDAVRLELQADCYAGIWTRYATRARDANGQPFILGLTRQDIANALDAARAVGDDRIQRQTSGRVDPDQWTHGSSAERMRWFRTGLNNGTLQACDTFSANRL